MIVNFVVLQMPPEQAFAFFATRISEWWPAERRHTKDPASQIFLLASGRFFERAGDGQEVELGKVTLWEDPHRIVADFYVATGPEVPTEVDILFEPEGSGTRITVTHGPKPESAHLWDERSPKYASSWQTVLASLTEHAPRR